MWDAGGIFCFIHKTGGGAAVIFFSAANNMRGAGVPEAGGQCLRNYKLILCGFICIIENFNENVHTIFVLILGTMTTAEIDLTGLNPTQSSTVGDGYPFRAVDGTTNGLYIFNSCTHTAIETDPWWRVELPGPHMITKVVLYNRIPHGHRLSPVYVYVQESSVDTLCGSHTTSSDGLAMLTFTCHVPILGDSLRVVISGSGVLTICEIKAYGRKV